MEHLRPPRSLRVPIEVAKDFADDAELHFRRNGGRHGRGVARQRKLSIVRNRAKLVDEDQQFSPNRSPSFASAARVDHDDIKLRLVEKLTFLSKPRRDFRQRFRVGTFSDPLLRFEILLLL